MFDATIAVGCPLEGGLLDPSRSLLAGMRGSLDDPHDALGLVLLDAHADVRVRTPVNRGAANASGGS